LSKTKNVNFVWKKGWPHPKPKYDLMIDSEQVPWGKGEKTLNGVKKNLKLRTYKQLKLIIFN